MHTHTHVWMVGNVNGWSSSVFGLGFDSQYAPTTGPRLQLLTTQSPTWVTCMDMSKLKLFQFLWGYED